MALTFGAATSDRVRIEASSVLNSMGVYTLWAWVYPTSLTADRRILSKLDSVAFNGWAWQFTSAGNGGNSGNLELYHSFSGTPDANAVANTLPLVVNRWNFIAASVDASNVPRLYRGLQDIPVAECGYASQVTGVGSPNNDSGNPIYLANEDTFATAFPGRIATLGVINGRALSVGDLRMIQYRPQAVPGTVMLFQELGFNGTKLQPDWSGHGNHGAVTGATVSGHPYRNVYQPGAVKRWQGYDGYGPYPFSEPRRIGFVAAAGAAVTYPQLERFGHRGAFRGMLH